MTTFTVRVKRILRQLNELLFYLIRGFASYAGSINKKSNEQIIKLFLINRR